MTDFALVKAVIFSSFEFVVLLFNGRDYDAVAEARTRWKDWKDAGHKLLYWQQSPQGAWEKKAES